MYYPIIDVEIAPDSRHRTHKGGTHTNIDNVSLKIVSLKQTYPCVIKQYGYEVSNKLSNHHLCANSCARLIHDILKLRMDIALSGLCVPRIYGVGFFPDNKTYKEVVELICSKSSYNNTDKNIRLVLLEEYVGNSLYDLLVSRKITVEQKIFLVNQVKRYIAKIPNNLTIDSNSKNFTHYKNNVYYVDCFPPNISTYQISEKMVYIFPELAYRGHFREERRRWRSYTRDGRLYKFNYYLTKQLNENLHSNKSD